MKIEFQLFMNRKPTHTHTHTHKKLSPPPPKPPSSSSTLTQPGPESTASRVGSSTLLTRWRTFGDASMSPCSLSSPIMNQCTPSSACLRHDLRDPNCGPMALPVRVRELQGVTGDHHRRKTQILLFLCLLLLHLISLVIFHLILLHHLV